MKHILVLAIVVLCAPGIDAESPNVVIILADDLGWRDLGCTGHPDHSTPHIDALAVGGMRFTNAYANAPNCAPTRACLMTGQYSPRHGVYTVNSSARGKAENRKLVPVKNRPDLDPGIATIPMAMKSAGYSTAMIGKWHLGDDPTRHGFDVNIAGTKAGHPKSYFSPYRNEALEDGPKGEYLTDRLTDEAVAFIESCGGKRFFLYLSHYAVHTPIQAKPELVAKYRDRGVKNPKYAAMVESLDDSVGRIMKVLEEQKLAEKTLVLFVSDNGGHGGVTSNAPLRGAKGMLYEGGIRVPWLMRWPGKIDAGETCDVPVITTDIFSTLLGIAEVDVPATHSIDGTDLRLLFRKDGKHPERTLFWHFPAYLEGNRRVGTWRTTPAAAIRRGRYKLIEFFEDGRRELYDLVDDPGETKDLAASKTEKRDELHAAMRKWREVTAAGMPKQKSER